MKASGILTLLTDFGWQDAYVAAMKGIIFSRFPDARLVDITHEIGPQNILQAGFVLAEAVRWYPAGTVHVVVVDPGVGTQRRALVAEVDEQIIVAPDNGVLSFLLGKSQKARCFELADPALGLKERSATFHGRDLFAPAAAMIASGAVLPRDCGPAIDPIVRMLRKPKLSRHGAQGEVVYVDRFGNLVTNVPGAALPAVRHSIVLKIGSQTIANFVQTYGRAEKGELVGLVGSHGQLEIARVEGDAAQVLACKAGASVQASWTVPA